MFYYIQGYLIILIETVCCINFYEAFFEQKERLCWYTKLGIIFLLTSMSWIIAWLNDYFIIKQISIVFVTALIMLLYIKGSLGKSIVLSVIFQSILLVADLITVIIDTSLLEQTENDYALANSLIIVLSKVILFLLVILIKKIFSKKYIEYIREIEWVKFLFFPLFSMGIIIGLVTNVYYISDTKMEKLTWILAFGLVCMNIFVFYFMQDIAKKEVFLKEKSIFELEVKNKLQLYESISENIQKQRELSHEFKNQIACMQALCKSRQYADLEDYLEEINEQILHDLDYIDTNHAFINAVLNIKYQEAVDKGILVICKINDLSRICIEASDIVLLLSNLLNNAIEACDIFSGEKVIKIKFVHETGNLVLSVKNTYNGVLNQNGDTFYTTKKHNKESHGIGIKNAIKVIQKYNGYYVIENIADEFLFTVIIPQET